MHQGRAWQPHCRLTPAIRGIAVAIEVSLQASHLCICSWPCFLSIQYSQRRQSPLCRSQATGTHWQVRSIEGSAGQSRKMAIGLSDCYRGGIDGLHCPGLPLLLKLLAGLLKLPALHQCPCVKNAEHTSRCCNASMSCYGQAAQRDPCTTKFGSANQVPSKRRVL